MIAAINCRSIAMGNQQSDRFSININEEERFLGSGSYGTVYKARRDADKFPCAAKVLQKELADPDPSNRERMKRTIQKIKDECSFLGGLKHTNIVQYLGITRDRNSRFPVLLMELLPDAENLTKMLENFRESSNEPLPYFIELNICCDIASAVDYLHSKNVIIRNLSSNNVLVIAKTRAKVTDFGMCRINDAMNTAFSGTTLYMPPEAFEQEPRYTQKLDCFSQGVIMIQVCTRKEPDPGNRMERVENSTAMQLISECTRRRNHIDEIRHRDELVSIAKDCLKDEADDRPTSSEIHERLANLKTTGELYQNSLKSDYKKLWKDIIEQVHLLMNDDEKIKEYTGRVRNEENTGEEATVNITEQFEQVLRNANKICILVIGTSGDGVSTLLNGLFGEEVCQSPEIAEEFMVISQQYTIRGVVEVTVIDCRNLHSNLVSIGRNVSEVIEAVRPHGRPDLIIYSQKMGENIDFVSQTKHKSIIARLAAGFADLDGSRAHKDIWKRCMFVLTFANEYEASLGELNDKVQRFNNRRNEWMKLFKQALNDESKVYVPMKVCIAGFRNTKLHDSDHWLSDVWLVAFLTLTKSGALALLQVNAFRFVKAALISEDLHPAEQLIIIDPSAPIINSIGAAAGIGVAGVASAATGAAIGGTIGAVGIGVISFGVAAGSGLALGVVIGSAVGLGVSGGVAAAVKRYKEDKNFRKLPPL